MIRVKIQEAAKKRGLENAAQFGRSIGVSNRVALRIWDNEQPPKLKTLDRICNAWRCRLSELIEHTPTTPSHNGHSSTAPQKRVKKPVRNSKPTASLSRSKRGR